MAKLNNGRNHKILAVGLLTLSIQSFIMNSALGNPNHPDNPNIVALERRSIHGLEQISLMLEGKKDDINIKILFTLNSNFLTNNLPARLGIFVRKDTKLTQAILEATAMKVSGDKSPPRHGTFGYINGKVIEPTDPLFKKITELLLEANNLDWVKQEGIEIKDKSDLKTFQCTNKMDSHSLCTGQFGYLHLPF